MPKYLNIEIPQSCHENWNAMQPKAQGRHCLSCEKTVVDFTAMTDVELINFFSNKKDNVCGRFTTEQLDRDILIPKKKIHWVKYFFQFALPAFLLSIKPGSKIFGQQHRTQATIEPIKIKHFENIIIWNTKISINVVIYTKIIAYFFKTNKKTILSNCFFVLYIYNEKLETF